MLLDIAEGIGGAAKTLPEKSRSAVGAVALKRAHVQIDFELSSGATREGGFGGLGVKTFLFGFGSSLETREDLARNHGRIELEVVAIIEPATKADSAEKAGGGLDRPDLSETPDSPDPTKVREAIAIAQAEIERLPLSETEKEKLRADLEKALALLSRGDVEGAVEILKQVGKAVAILSQQPGTVVRHNDPR